MYQFTCCYSCDTELFYLQFRQMYENRVTNILVSVHFYHHTMIRFHSGFKQRVSQECQMCLPLVNLMIPSLSILLQQTEIQIEMNFSLSLWTLANARTSENSSLSTFSINSSHCIYLSHTEYEGFPSRGHW